MKNVFDIHPTTDNNELSMVYAIRKQVFIEEQSVPYEIEMDDYDDEAIHFIALLDDVPIGCARIRLNKSVKLERVAILKDYRNQGFGTKLTNYLIGHCRKKGCKKIHIHSQLYVRDFYKKFGFIETGDVFLEAGIEHVAMYREL